MSRGQLLLATGVVLACATTLIARDCNRNGVDDFVDVSSGSSQDCNENDLPDECDVSPRDFRFTEEAKVVLGPRPVDAYPADLVPDGEIDLVVVVRDSRQVFFLKNLGNFVFGTPQPLPLDMYQPHVAAGDFDGDGNVDLAAVGGRDTQLVLLWNDGTGSFSDTRAIEFKSQRSILAADLDNDGDMDLCTVDDVQEAHVNLFFNTGEGDFEEPVSFVVVDGPRDVIAADFDGDGITDLAFVRSGGGVVFFGSREPNGSGGVMTRFTRPENFLLGGVTMVAGDLDGDGDLDIAGAGYSDDHVHLAFNKGGGAFGDYVYIEVSPGSREVVSGDFDQDDDVDLAVPCEPSGEVFILRNRGDGRFDDPIPFEATERAYAVSSFDFDRDGRLDLLAINSDFETVTYASLLVNESERSLQNDCDLDGTLDECQPDCDRDGTPDVCAIAEGAPDDNDNGLPDECEIDCNGNGAPDGLDIQDGASNDCNANGIPDECDLAPSFGFPGPTRILVGDETSMVAVADVNGDGDLDIVAACPGAHVVKVLKGSGNRTFGEPVDYAAGLYPADIAAGDCDADGDVDLVVPNARSAEVSLLKNDGRGRFRVASTFPVGAGPRRAQLEDLDGDQDLDLVVAKPEASTVVIWSNDGAGVFSFHQELTAAPGVERFILADLEMDGDVDLAATVGTGTNYIFLNSGPPEWWFGVVVERGAGIIGPLVAIDVDADGDRDIVQGGHELYVIENLGGGNFGYIENLGVSEDSNVLGTGDLDGNGVLDLLLVKNDVMKILKARLEGGFEAAVNHAGLGYVMQVGTADGDGDGDLDVFANAGTVGEVLLFWNDGSGRMTAGQDYVAGGPWRMQAADLNGDGALDLLTANQFGNELSLLSGHGDGTFDDAVTFPTVGPPAAILPDDCDADGDMDLLVAAAWMDGVSVSLNEGGGVFTPGTPISVDDRVMDILALDFDGDGDRDLALIPASGEAVVLRRNLGDGTYQPAGVLSSEAVPQHLGAADVDGDGDIDLDIVAVGPFLSRELILYLNDGMGAFTQLPGVLQAGDGPGPPLGLDSDGDGDQDLAIANQTSSTLTLWRNAGGGRFLDSDTYPLGDEPNGLVAADLDRDGYLELVASNNDGSFVSVLRNDGKGGFGKEIRLPARAGHYGLIADYLDGDGDIDLAVANRASSVSVFLNQSDRVNVIDCDKNGRRDEFDLKASDCNANDVPDRVDLSSKRSADCDDDGVPDECALASGEASDVNDNGVLDRCEHLPFHRGDPNDSGRTDLADAVYILGYLFVGDSSPIGCLESTDVDNDGTVNITDALRLLNFLFLGGAAPAPPGSTTEPCGQDPDSPNSLWSLGCAVYESCTGTDA